MCFACTGWIGLGVSANGGMYGADLAVLRAPEASAARTRWLLEDRFAAGFVMPTLDRQQDVLLEAVHADADGRFS